MNYLDFGPNAVVIFWSMAFLFTMLIAPVGFLIYKAEREAQSAGAISSSVPDHL